MKEGRYSQNLMRILVVVLVVAAGLWLPLEAAYGNSAEPPTVVWLMFEYQIPDIPRLLGVQLLGCQTPTCEQPLLLQQYGKCEAPECVVGTEILTGYSNSLDCTREICRSEVWPSHGGTDFRLVVVYSDRVRTSEVTGKLPDHYSDQTITWQVTVTETDLSLTQVDGRPEIADPTGRFEENLVWVGLSIGVELLVAGLCFHVWARSTLRSWLGRLLMVLLVNLLSVPMVWLFFPTLGKMQHEYDAMVGVLTLFVVLLYTGLLVFVYHSTARALWWKILLVVLSLPLSFACVVLGLFVTAYGGDSVNVHGLSATAVIVIAEVFAVVYEAVMITVLSRRSLPTALIWVTSLLMNAASFTIGQVVLNLPL